MSGTLNQGVNRKISRSASVVSLVQAYNEEGQVVNEMIFSPDGKRHDCNGFGTVFLNTTWTFRPHV